MAIECSACGLAPIDLPDGIDPDLFFEFDERSRTYHCPPCLAKGNTHGHPVAVWRSRIYRQGRVS